MGQKIRKIIALLHRAYGRPRPWRRTDPVDELVRTVLSQNTNDRNSLAAFAILKRAFRSWKGVLDVDTRRLARLIRHAGLANIKAARIKGILEEIRRREGEITLSSLKSSDIRHSLEYLTSLKGVGPKTASCVLLFSFGKPVMPVDTHIFRVAKRLGLIEADSDIAEAHRILTGAVPKSLIYEFHLGIIEHGRRTCRARDPRCGECLLYRVCRFDKKEFFSKRGQR
ncbi:MAG: endonuclease III [Candidatus Omnitrophota bacterium]